MFSHLELFAGGASALAVIFGTLWRRSLLRSYDQEHRWRRALDAVAWRDYGRIRALADIVEIAERRRWPWQKSADEESFSKALRRMVERLEHQELDQQEQHAARRELEDVLASLQDAVLVVDEKTHLRFLNSAALTMFGVRIQDVLGAQLLEALPSFGLEAAVNTALIEGRNSISEISLYAPQLREVLLRTAPVRRSDGTISGAVAIVQDMTELRRLERVRRDFVANASHELRTPIANIRASAETILDSPEDPALITRFLPQLVSEAERLSRLVSDLLDLARADAQVEAQVEAAKTAVDLCAVVRSVEKQLAEKARQQQITVESFCLPSPPVLGDAAALEQVAFNLLDNALIYTPSGGKVTLRVSPKENTINDERFASPDTVVLEVEDTGMGIPSVDLPRVFERFYRVDKARSRAQGGTGLGLAIVKHIVENHGGHVSVESEAGRGSRFLVTLPTI